MHTLFSKNVPNFCRLNHNFGRSDSDYYLVKKCSFPLDAYVVSCPTRSKNLERTLLRIRPFIFRRCTFFWQVFRSSKIGHGRWVGLQNRTSNFLELVGSFVKIIAENWTQFSKRNKKKERLYVCHLLTFPYDKRFCKINALN